MNKPDPIPARLAALVRALPVLRITLVFTRVAAGHFQPHEMSVAGRLCAVPNAAVFARARDAAHLWDAYPLADVQLWTGADADNIRIRNSPEDE